jgi:hypothetical protein
MPGTTNLSEAPADRETVDASAKTTGWVFAHPVILKDAFALRSKCSSPKRTQT